MKSCLQKMIWAFMVLLLPIMGFAAPEWQRTFTTTNPDYILQVVLLFDGDNASMVEPGDMVAFFDADEITGVATVEDRNGKILALPNVHTQAGKEYTVKIWKKTEDQIYVMSTTFETPADAEGVSYYMTIGFLSLEVGCDVALSIDSDEVCAGDELALVATPQGGTWSGDGVTESVFTSEKSGEYVLTYEFTLDGCDVSKDTTVTVNELPVIVEQEDVVFCQNIETLPVISITSDDTYTIEGPYVDNNEIYVPAVIETGAQEHIITYTNEKTCSVKDTFEITINSTGGADVNLANVVATIADETATFSATPTAGGILTWTGQTIEETTGNELIVSLSGYAEGEYDFQVYESNDGCVSELTTVTLTVVVEGCAVNPPSVEDQEFTVSEEKSLTVLNSSTDVTYTWYLDNETSAVGTGPVLDIEITEIGEYIYSVTETDGDCVSEPTTIVVTVVEEGCDIADPVVAEVTYMLEEIKTLNVSEPVTGVTYSWYDAEDATAAFETGEEITISDITEAGVYTYYVVASENDCESAMVSVQMIVIDECVQPITPTVEDAELTVCDGDSYEFIVTSDQPVAWFTEESSDGEEIATNTQFSPTEEGTYYGYSKVKDHCYSDLAVAVTLTINQTPEAPIAPDVTADLVDDVATLNVTSASGLSSSSFEWKDKNGVTVGIGKTIDIDFDNAGSYIYSVTETNVTCASEPTVVTLTVNGDDIVYTELIELISSANEILDNATEGSEVGQYNPGSKADLQKEVDIAEGVVDNAADQSEVTSAINSLQDAIDAFEKEKVIGEKSDLDDAISEATSLYDKVKDLIGSGNGQYPSSVVSALDSEISNAKDVFDDSNATQSQIEDAEQALLDAIDAVNDGKIVVDLSGLDEYIKQAEDQLAIMEQNTGFGLNEYPASAVTELKNAISDAKDVVNTIHVLASAVATAESDLSDAISDAKASKITKQPFDSKALVDAISDAEDLFDIVVKKEGSMVDQYPAEAVKKFKDAIADAKDNLKNAETEADITSAVSDLSEAVDAINNSLVVEVLVESIEVDQDLFYLRVGEIIKLDVVVGPSDATNKAVVMSLDADIAVVNSSSYIITALKEGFTTLTIESADGGGASFEIDLIITGGTAISDADLDQITAVPTVVTSDLMVSTGDVVVENAYIVSENGVSTTLPGFNEDASIDLSTYASGVYKLVFVKEGKILKTIPVVKK